MSQEMTIEIEGIDEALQNINNLAKGIERQVLIGLEKAMANTADDIKVTYKGGGSAPGFRDRSGALRASIRGGVTDSMSDGDEVGFVGAGDDTIGSEGKATREYVKYIEFGEFSRAGSTSFLRDGVQKNMRQIVDIIKEAVGEKAMSDILDGSSEATSLGQGDKQYFNSEKVMPGAWSG